jgi:hypothetical protein
MKLFFCCLASVLVAGLGIVVLAATPVPSATSAVSSLGSVAPSSPMLEPRSGHSATLLPDGKVLIAGGMRRNSDFYRSAELYDPATAKFERTGDLNLSRVGHGAVLLGSGRVLIVGGWTGHGSTDSAELYDPATRKFTVIAKMTVRRGEPRATRLTNGDVLITGGDDHDGLDAHLASAEIFHASTLSFQATGSMHDARVSHTATLLQDGRVLVVGGHGAKLNASAELYDLKTGKFVETGSLITARYKHTAGLLSDGRVLIAGGSDDRDWNGNLNSAEIYDPHTGKFTAASALNDARFKLSEEAVSLRSGNLLIAGGSKETEIFGPATGKFSIVAGQMNQKWHYMSETGLRDGSVLMAGGYANDDLGTAQTWIYRP